MYYYLQLQILRYQTNRDLVSDLCAPRCVYCTCIRKEIDLKTTPSCSCYIIYIYESAEYGIRECDVVLQPTELLLKTIVRNAFVVKCVVFSYWFSERIIANGVKVLVGRAQTINECAFNTVFLFTVRSPGRNIKSLLEIAVPCPTPLGAKRV